MTQPSKNQATTTKEMWSNIHEVISIIYTGKKGYFGKLLQERINAFLSDKAIDDITDFLLSPDWQIKG